MLKFDKRTTAILENAYQGADLTRRRQASFDALDPQPGEVIVDIGCGNGLLTAEIARAVGSEGRVIGVDPSEDMLTAGRQRCNAFDCAEFHNGVAGALPVEDGIADRAVSVQVFEYIEDVVAALSDGMRCLKPGGRLVISDLHFGSFIWYSDHPARMATIKSSWDRHFASGTLPERLPGLLRSEGHHVEAVTPFTMVDHVLKADGIAIMMLHLMRQYALDNHHVEPDVAQAWFEEQFQLARKGRFFFSLTQFVIVVRKSGQSPLH